MRSRGWGGIGLRLYLDNGLLDLGFDLRRVIALHPLLDTINSRKPLFLLLLVESVKLHRYHDSDGATLFVLHHALFFLLADGLNHLAELIVGVLQFEYLRHVTRHY